MEACIDDEVVRATASSRAWSSVDPVGSQERVVGRLGEQAACCESAVELDSVGEL